LKAWRKGRKPNRKSVVCVIYIMKNLFMSFLIKENGMTNSPKSKHHSSNEINLRTFVKIFLKIFFQKQSSK
jgi:hypothetical protein